MQCCNFVVSHIMRILWYLFFTPSFSSQQFQQYHYLMTPISHIPQPKIWWYLFDLIQGCGIYWTTMERGNNRPMTVHDKQQLTNQRPGKSPFEEPFIQHNALQTYQTLPIFKPSTPAQHTFLLSLYSYNQITWTYGHHISKS